MEDLKKFNPLGMTRLEFLLAIDVFEGFMIEVKNELFSYEIVEPMIKSSHNGIKLLVISGVGIIIEFLTKIGYWSTILRENRPNTNSRGITLHLKGILEIRKGKSRGIGELFI